MRRKSNSRAPAWVRWACGSNSWDGLDHLKLHLTYCEALQPQTVGPTLCYDMQLCSRKTSCPDHDRRSLGCMKPESHSLVRLTLLVWAPSLDVTGALRRRRKNRSLDKAFRWGMKYRCVTFRTLSPSCVGDVIHSSYLSRNRKALNVQVYIWILVFYSPTKAERRLSRVRHKTLKV